MWPNENVAMFGEKEIIELSQYFEVLLGNGKCDMTKIFDELKVWKTYIVFMIINNKSFGYLEIWKRVFTNHKVKTECMNVLHILEILLSTRFTNAKVERMFSKIARIKAD